ncbi:hypothetical protein IJJ27_00060 [bacterium]|nr:hypothetical protein [bacterium]
MMTATLSCPHGKMIAGKHVKCFNCPSDATYDSTNVTCTCNNPGNVWDWEVNACVIAKTPTDGDQTNCINPIGYMDSWNGRASLSEFDTVCLTDRRDYRTYRVRKFADNQCWMIDSLRFGGISGQVDGCLVNNGEGNFTYSWCGGSGPSSCTAGGSVSLVKAQETFVAGYYGHCRAINSTYNNYLYDWVATLQNTLAYAGSATTFDGIQQGLCPQGWHVPFGGASGDFQALASIYGTVSNVFWTETSKWNGQFSGNAGSSSGGLYDLDVNSAYWSSTASSTTAMYRLFFNDSTIYPKSLSTKGYGFALRCIKD